MSQSEEERLRDELHAKLAAIVESSDDAIVSKTLDGVIRTWNSGAERIFGYTAAEAVGKPILLIIPPERQDEEPHILERLRRGERVDHFETVRVRKDGRQVEVSVTISPIRDSTGVIVGASKIARDITLQKQILRELETAKAAAESASRAKDLFLSILSHELRTPLTPVLGALGILQGRSDLPPGMLEELEMMRRNVETQARLVDDLLDLTRISRGKVQLHFETVDAHASLRDALTMFQPDIDAKSLSVSVALRAKEHHVWADVGRLQQIFANLLSNAVKFTAEGGSLELRSASDESGRVVLNISDSGIGIEPDMLARLFKPFEQGEVTTTRQFGGLGLGLAITRSLIQMHDGTIRALSEGKGRGATFEVGLPTVPLPTRQASTDRDRTGSAALNLRILLVEDHADSRRVLGKLLESFGCVVKTAGTVADALAVAEHESFDLLVSDIGLPDGSGIDIMRQMRTRQDIKGIALSGFGQAEDLRRSEEAGFEVHLTKPINFRALQDVIEKVAK